MGFLFINMQKRKKPLYNNKKGVIRIKGYKDTTHDTKIRHMIQIKIRHKTRV
jgi:hypothetical protein